MAFADVARSVVLFSASTVLVGCSSPSAAPSGQTPNGGSPPSGDTVTQVYESVANLDLDLLVMVDDSRSMHPLQTKLAESFPAFVNQLAGLPHGLPRLHLGVVSSSLGAGPTTPTIDCPVDGDHGEFQSTPRVVGCATGLPADQHFLSSIDGVNNFTGDLASAFSCIAQLGDSGCGFEHQFASVLRALEPGQQPAANQGFLRPSAYLAIVLFTNEDDCSAPPDSDLFDNTSMSVSDPLGPMMSFRCNEFGHLCGGQKPPRTPAVLTNCTSAEDGRLLKVSDVVARTKKLKSDPSKIIVAAVAAPATPYEVIIPNQVMAANEGYIQDVANIKHSCESPDGTYGDPSVRIQQWVDAFKGSFVSICNLSFKPALSQLADQIRAAMGPQCLQGKLVDDDPKAPGLQPRCTVTDVLVDDKGATTETLVPRCTDSLGVLPCWNLSPDQTACGPQGGTLLAISRAGGAATGNLSTRVTCAVCKPGDARAGCSY